MIIEGYNDNTISNTTNKHSNDKHLDIAENTDNDLLTDNITHIPIENTRMENNILSVRTTRPEKCDISAQHY